MDECEYPEDEAKVQKENVSGCKEQRDNVETNNEDEEEEEEEEEEEANWSKPDDTDENKNFNRDVETRAT